MRCFFSGTINHFVITASIVCLLISTGCGDNKNSSDKPVIVLKIHAWDGYAREYETDFISYMEKDKNIKINLQITNTTGLDSFRDAIKNKAVHLVSPAHDFVTPLQRENLLIQLDSTRLSRYRQINPLILSRKSTEIGGILYAIPFNFGPYILAYNKDTIQKPLSYKALWDPKNRGRVTIPGHYPTINIYMTALMLGIPKKDIFRLNDSQLTRIEEKLRYLCKNQVSDFWDENINPEKRDKFDIGMDWGIGVNKINRDYNGHWGIVIPEEGVTGWIDTWAITVNIRDQDTLSAAYSFIDFMLSPEIQAKMAKITTYAPVNPYAARYLRGMEKEMFHLVDPRELIEKMILWQPLDSETLKRYNMTWERAYK